MNEPKINKISAKDTTFLIPVRIDSPDRRENLDLVLEFLKKYFDTNVMVLEADRREMVESPLIDQKIFITDDNPVFHRTRYLNRMTKMAKTPYLAIWDADVIGIPEQLEQSINLLRNCNAEMVYPYSEYFYSVPGLIKKLFVDNGKELNILLNSVEYMTKMHDNWSVGGGFLVDKKAYMKSGMENEHFFGWGPEDAERYTRWEILGYKIERVDGSLFHLPHPRGITSRFASNNIEKRNRNEYLKICAMSPLELETYVKDSSWNSSQESVKEKDISIIDFPRKPTTSWVIRTLNEEKWLGRVLESLFLQSRLDFEIIIVDSGSTDKTMEIIDSYPIRMVINVIPEKFNYSKALNQGIREAWGRYIGIISGHSLPVSRTWYEDVMRNFEDTKVAAVSGHYYSLPDGSYSEKMFDLRFFNLGNLKKVHHSKLMTNTNAIIRKDLWEQYHFDESLLRGCEDYDWACEMLSLGYDVIIDPAFNVYHSHGGIGRPTILERFPEWNEICKIIDQKNRPSI